MKRKEPLAAAQERGRKELLKLLNAEGGVIELENRDVLRCMMEQYKVFIAKIGDEQVVPLWQFDERVYPHIPGILNIFRRKKLSDLAAMSFFVSGNMRLLGVSPLMALRAGRIKDVMRAARSHLDHGAA